MFFLCLLLQKFVYIKESNLVFFLTHSISNKCPLFGKPSGATWEPAWTSSIAFPVSYQTALTFPNKKSFRRNNIPRAPWVGPNKLTIKKDIFLIISVASASHFLKMISSFSLNGQISLISILQVPQNDVNLPLQLRLHFF